MPVLAAQRDQLRASLAGFMSRWPLLLVPPDPACVEGEPYGRQGVAGSVPRGRAFSFLSNPLAGSNKAAGGREVSCRPAACDRPLLTLGGSVGAAGSIGGDVASWAWCVAFPAGRSWRRTFGAGSQGVSWAPGSFKEAWGRARDGRWPGANRGFGISKRIWQIVNKAGLQVC